MARSAHKLSFLPARGLAGVEMATREYRGPIMPAYVAHGFVLSIIDEGEASVRIAGQVHHVSARSVTLAEPGDLLVAVKRNSVATRVRTLSIDSTAFIRPTDLALPAGSSRMRSGLVRDRDVTVSLRRVLKGVVGRDDEQELHARYTLLLAAMLGYEPEGTVMAARAVVRRARGILHDRWSETVRLDELCKEVGADRFYLIRAFAREVGVTPHAYQVLLRVARARALLRAGRSLRDICVDAGFADQSHLSRHFSRVVGITPGAYARLVRRAS